MFRRLREARREVHPDYMTEETRLDLAANYTAIAESYQRLAELEESRLEALHSPLRRVRQRLRLSLCRANERAARADVERLKR